MSNYVFSDLLSLTKDGEWGQGEDGVDLEPMHVVRGTDFAQVRLGNVGGLPLRYIPKRIADRKALQEGDIVFETAGGTKDQPTGRSVLMSEQVFKSATHRIICASFSRFLRVKPDLVDPGFLYWHLQAAYKSGVLLPYHIQHTGVARFQYTDFSKSHHVQLPPLSEQRRISRILSEFDEKIALNGRMNETIEGLAKSIFKDWFVDFGPTRAKIEGRARYLTADIWSLFPDNLSDVGIPAGWQLQPLDTIAEFLNGLALQKFPAKDGRSLPVIKITQLRSGKADSGETASSEIPPRYIVHDGDHLFSWSGSLIHAIWAGGTGALNQHLFKVTPLGYPQWFTYFNVDVHMPEFQSIAASKATTMGHIQRHHLSSAIATVPSKNVIVAADNLISPLFEKIKSNRMEARTLETLRDQLLPRLMSGEVSLRSTEEAMEEAME